MVGLSNITIGDTEIELATQCNFLLSQLSRLLDC